MAWQVKVKISDSPSNSDSGNPETIAIFEKYFNDGKITNREVEIIDDTTKIVTLTYIDHSTYRQYVEELGSNNKTVLNDNYKSTVEILEEKEVD